VLFCFWVSNVVKRTNYQTYPYYLYK
jgi:hypothetical protein